MIAVVKLISTIITLFTWVVIIRVVLDWLIYLEVINTYNKFVAQIQDIARRITDPVLKPIARALTPITQSIRVDLSPLVLILLLYFARDLLWELVI
jgi:YggT family protein